MKDEDRRADLGVIQRDDDFLCFFILAFFLKLNKISIYNYPLSLSLVEFEMINYPYRNNPTKFIESLILF